MSQISKEKKTARTDEEIERLYKKLSKEVKRDEKREKRRKIRLSNRQERRKKRYLREKIDDYVPKTKRGFGERMRNVISYKFGHYDGLYYEELDDLSEEEKEDFWDEVDELARAKVDCKKLRRFNFALAGIGIAIAVGVEINLLFKLRDKLFEPLPTQIEMPTTLITTKTGIDLENEKVRAKDYSLKFRDQEYLLSRINKNFIPENVTEEEMQSIMQEAWESLEPEVQEWIRSPEFVRELEIKKQEEEERRRKQQEEIEEIMRAQATATTPYQIDLNTDTTETEFTEVFDSDGLDIYEAEAEALENDVFGEDEAKTVDEISDEVSDGVSDEKESEESQMPEKEAEDEDFEIGD